MSGISFRRFMNFLALQKYTLAFLVLLIALPFSAFQWGPAHSLLGGMFLELGAIAIFWMTMAFFATAWSIMFVMGIMVEGVREGDVSVGTLPQWAFSYFGVSVSRKKFLIFTSTALFGVGITLWFANRNEMWKAVPMAVISYLIAYLGMILILAPTRLARPEYDPLGNRVAKWIWDGLAKVAGLRAGALVLYRLFSKIAGFLPFLNHLLEDKAAGTHSKTGRLLLPEHFQALTTFLSFAILSFLLAIFFPPNLKAYQPTSGVYLFALLNLMLWVFGALHFQMIRLRFSPLWVILLFVLIVYPLSYGDHMFRTKLVELPAQDRPLPVEVVRASRGGKNLVVITATGGGILASGWTTMFLQRAIGERAQFKDEIRLLSTVSGSSVGAAFYLDGLLRNQIQPDPDRPMNLSATLQEIFDDATASSLVGSIYGYAFLDFPRLITGGLFPISKEDRGTMLENTWQVNSVTNSATRKRDIFHPEFFPMHDFIPHIKAGNLPAFIFNATAMEVGRRVMLTPVRFPDLEMPYQRAETQTEFFTNSEHHVLEMNLWTAARLSATFPYVAPAAKPDFEGVGKLPPQARLNHAQFHLIDGGYYDNYGVSSALDWLEPVLDAKLAEPDSLAFERVLIIQLRAFKPSQTDLVKAANAGQAALFGPLIGVTAIYSGAAITRNDIDIRRFLDHWNARLKSQAVVIDTVVFEREDSGGPLSWHMTEKQIQADLKQRWPTTPAPDADRQGSLAQRWTWMNRFLDEVNAGAERAQPESPKP